MYGFDQFTSAVDSLMKLGLEALYALGYGSIAFLVAVLLLIVGIGTLIFLILTGRLTYAAVKRIVSWFVNRNNGNSNGREEER